MEAAIELAPSQARIVPLTFQQRFLLEARKKSHMVSRLDSMTLRLCGKVRPELLLRSFEELIRRHDSLRTRLIEVSGTWAQKITDFEECQVRSRDISDGSDDGDEELAFRCLDEFNGRRWNLDDQPLFYVEVLKLSERCYFLSYILHHLIIDATSINLMFREIWPLYTAHLRGQQPMLPDELCQYSDYAVQQQRAEFDWSQKHDPYWQARLDGASRVIWPSDGGTAGIKTCATALARATMDADLILRSRKLAQRERTLLSLVMLATHVAVVSQRCQVKNFIVPMVVSGRNSAQEGAMVGYMAHFLYLRIQLTGDERFVDLLDNVKREFNQAMLHQDSGRLSVRAPELVRGISFSWLKWHWEESCGVPTQAESSTLDAKVEVYPSIPFVQIVNFKPMETEGPAELLSEMAIQFLEARDGLVLVLRYRADLYSAAAAARVLAAVPMASAKLLRDPYARISTLALDLDH